MFGGSSDLSVIVNVIPSTTNVIVDSGDASSAHKSARKRSRATHTPPECRVEAIRAHGARILKTVKVAGVFPWLQPRAEVSGRVRKCVRFCSSPGRGSLSSFVCRDPLPQYLSRSSMDKTCELEAQPFCQHKLKFTFAESSCDGMRPASLLLLLRSPLHCTTTRLLLSL